MADRLCSDHTLFTLKGGCGTNKKLVMNIIALMIFTIIDNEY